MSSERYDIPAAIDLLRKQDQKTEQFIHSQPFPEGEYKKWLLSTRNLLERIFGEDSSFPVQFSNAGKDDNADEYSDHFRALRERRVVLQSCIEVLENEELLDARVQSDSQNNEKSLLNFNNDKVFLVHGHDEGARETVARFIENLGLEVIILHEQANEGRTIIEKFLHHSECYFAVVLLTGDDKGGAKDTPHDKQKFRARQNVILELGFFLAKLGRKRVCALYEDGVERPSDYDGVLFIPLNGNWKIELAREMKQAGLPVDMDKIR